MLARGPPIIPTRTQVSFAEHFPMPDTTVAPTRSNTILWILVILAIVALIIDLIDGYTPKTLTSLGLLVGLASILLVRLTGKRAFNWLAVVGFVVCIGSAAFRAAVHQRWI